MKNWFYSIRALCVVLSEKVYALKNSCNLILLQGIANWVSFEISGGWINGWMDGWMETEVGLRDCFAHCKYA